jgi:hypothetical protein
MQGLQFLAASARTEDLYFLLVEFEEDFFMKDGFFLAAELWTKSIKRCSDS